LTRIRKVLLVWVGPYLLVLALFLFLAAPAMVDARMNKTRPIAKTNVSAPARQLHQQLFIADLHADSLLWGRNLLKRSSRGHVDLPRLQEGNVALQAFTVVTKVPYGLNIERNSGKFDEVTPLVIANRWSPSTWTSLMQRALYQAHKLEKFAADSNGRLVIVRNRAELESLAAQRNSGNEIVGAYLGIEGAHALEGKMENLDTLEAVGFRTIGLAHFFDNEFAGSAHGIQKGGLTSLGQELVSRIEQKHMIVDLAHSSPQTIADVLKMAKRPVIVSHTGVKGTCNNQRNLSDAEVKAIATGGGLIGIGYWQTAVCANDAKAVARAIRYTADLAGIDHVALGSDFDGAVNEPFDTSQLVLLTQALLDVGFNADEIQKVMGGNVREFMLRNLPEN
jgi:membrane dipeptidase